MGVLKRDIREEKICNLEIYLLGGKMVGYFGYFISNMSTLLIYVSIFSCVYVGMNVTGASEEWKTRWMKINGEHDEMKMLFRCRIKIPAEFFK